MLIWIKTHNGIYIYILKVSHRFFLLIKKLSNSYMIGYGSMVHQNLYPSVIGMSFGEIINHLEMGMVY